MSELHEQERFQPARIYIQRTPWRTRLVVWPGMAFRTLPFPYLFHRYDVQSTATGWCGSFFLRRHAEDRLTFMELLEEIGDGS
jgi:hypothetical protein